jgi:hypothetical protein
MCTKTFRLERLLEAGLNLKSCDVVLLGLPGPRTDGSKRYISRQNVCPLSLKDPLSGWELENMINENPPRERFISS